MTFSEIRSQAVRTLRQIIPSHRGLTRKDARDALHGCKDLLSFVTSAGMPVASRTVVAGTFIQRFKGLLIRINLHADEGMLLVPGGSIHTFGMRFAIDVLFLDRHMRVLRCIAGLAPWRMALAPPGTSHVLELAAGRIVAANIKTGTRLLWSDATTHGDVQ